ncbi:translation initiation factor IF-2-like [Mustela putorius furo]|uniref:Translation initiation factor IF-2-like n=1 Tax=Mustela putorius furo TaxID=9669 RepID=A0A8U0UW71_MUSPF|nr:translation initiation factor IF-2-like [Mustela putorius furo]
MQPGEAPGGWPARVPESPGQQPPGSPHRARPASADVPTISRDVLGTQAGVSPAQTGSGGPGRPRSPFLSREPVLPGGLLGLSGGDNKGLRVPAADPPEQRTASASPLPTGPLLPSSACGFLGLRAGGTLGLREQEGRKAQGWGLPEAPSVLDGVSELMVQGWGDPKGGPGARRPSPAPSVAPVLQWSRQAAGDSPGLPLKGHPELEGKAIPRRPVTLGSLEGHSPSPDPSTP